LIGRKGQDPNLNMLTDFQLKHLEDEETTLGDIIDKAKLQFIHFYLRTRLQKQISDDYDDRQKEEIILLALSMNNKKR
jgi:hypothetical protein